MPNMPKVFKIVLNIWIYLLILVFWKSTMPFNSVVKDANKISFIYNNKFLIPIIITLGFFLSTSYLAFFQNIVWTETDGIYYLNFGRAILDDNGKNVIIVNGQIGASVLFAFLESIFHDAFVVVKTIAILSGSAIVFLSFFITRNIFDFRIATVVALFFAFQPRLHFVSTQALNELLPVAMIMCSLFFLTRKNPVIIHYVLIGTLLGFSSIFRLQAAFILLAILLFLLLRSKNIRKNISSVLIVSIFFFLALSPQLIYNVTTHGEIWDAFPGYYIGGWYYFQTPEWHDQVANTPDIDIMSIMLLDVDLFLKNYSSNLFFFNPDKLLNFGSLDNLSIFPFVPFIGVLFLIFGIIYMKTSSQSIPNNFLPLLILPIVYLPLISLMPVYRSWQLLPILLPIIILSTVFLVDAVPKIISKFKKQSSPNDFKFISVAIIIVILLLNFGFTYKLVDASFYGNTSKIINYENITTTFFQPNDISKQPSMEIKHIAEILSKEPNIENKYIMATSPSVSYYTNSNFIFAEFKEGGKDISIDDYLHRIDWNEYEIFQSNIHSYPPNRLNNELPVPDYLIYRPLTADPYFANYGKLNNDNLEIFLNPNDKNIPNNFELLYKSNQTNTVVYKIINNEP